MLAEKSRLSPKRDRSEQSDSGYINNFWRILIVIIIAIHGAHLCAVSVNSHSEVISAEPELTLSDWQNDTKQQLNEQEALRDYSMDTLAFNASQ